MQPPGNLVGIIVKFSAGMQYRHDDFCRGASFFLVYIDRNSTTIILDRYRAIDMYHYPDLGTMPGQSFVDRVIDRFEYHVMQAGTVIGIADIHAGPLAYGIKAF